MTNIMTPTNKDSVSVRRTPQSVEDRKRQLKEFKEDKEHKEQLKAERYAKMKENRKRKPSGGKGHINIEVTGDPS